MEEFQNMIDWDLKHVSHKNSTKNTNRWLCKHSTGFCGVGKMLLRYKYQSHSTCPQCGVSQETTSHVLQCKDAAACALWDNEVEKLKDWMVKKKVEPNLANIISKNLHAWKYRLPLSQSLPANNLLRTAIQQQDRIGWKQFMEGFWSIKWKECQQQHFNNINSPTSSLLLLSKVQRRVWRIAWLMWEHRNHHLHDKISSCPVVEQTAINDEVKNEWNLGLSTLLDRYRYLFNGTLDVKLQKSYHSKRLWLASVWTAQETVDINHLVNNQLQTDTTIRLRFEKWKRRQQIDD